MIRFSLLALTLLCLQSCAIPGSMGAFYKLKGKVINEKTSKPEPGLPISIVLPGSHGLSASDAFMAPFKNDQVNKLKTENDGSFAVNHEKVVSAALMLVPPLGWFPKIMYPPHYWIKASDQKCVRLWNVYFRDEKLKYQVYIPKEEEFISPPNSSTELTGEVKPCSKDIPSCKNTRESTVQINWNPDKYCSDTTMSNFIKHKPKNRRHGLFLHHAELIDSSSGFVYKYKIDRYGVFQAKAPFAFNNSSMATAALVQMDLLKMHWTSLTFGVGPQFTTHKSNVNIDDEWSFHGYVELNITIKKEFSFTLGYGTTEKVENSKYEKWYLNLGWWL